MVKPGATRLTTGDSFPNPLSVSSWTGPLGTAASTRYGARPVVMLGGLLSSLGIFGAAFSTSLFQLYLSLGFLTGESGTTCFPERVNLHPGLIKMDKMAARA